MSAIFAVAADSWVEEKRKFVKNSTYSVYKTIVEKELKGRFDPDPLNFEASTQEYILSLLDRGLSPKTSRDILTVIRMIHEHGAKMGFWTSGKLRVQFPVLPKASDIPVMNLGDERMLLVYLKRNLSFRNLGLIICLYSGMRIGEICSLKWEDIDLKDGVIRVRRTIQRVYSYDESRSHLQIDTPKTQSSSRDIPIARELRNLVHPLIRIVDPKNYIVTNSPKAIEPRSYRNYFYRLCDELSIPRIRFHGLRHSFATRCVESGCDYKTLSSILGHTNISTTLNLYVHPDNRQKLKCIERMVKSL